MKGRITDRCPDCNQGQLEAIKIFNRSTSGDSQLAYTSDTAKPDWRGRYLIDGLITARACTGCGLVQWHTHALPKQTSHPVTDVAKNVRELENLATNPTW